MSEISEAHKEFAKAARGNPAVTNVGFNPSSSERQRRFMGAALARKRAGKSRSSDPQMSEEKLGHFAAKVK
jgi:hypothetical protein